MQIKRASRKKAKLKIGLFGPSGSGKTYSALQMASGFTDWEKIVVIDTERQSADLYSHLGPYSTLQLTSFEPETYIQAIKLCEREGFEVIVIDSITHEWEKIIDISNSMQGNSFTNWGKLTPRHNSFIDAILGAKCHVICCARSEEDYVLTENDKGKMAPVKMGLKAVTRKGFDYEMTLCFDINIKHFAVSSKDRTGLFMDKPEFIITPDTGKQLLTWSNEGEDLVIDPIDVLKGEVRKLMLEHNISIDKAQEIAGKVFSQIESEGDWAQVVTNLRISLIGVA